MEKEKQLSLFTEYNDSNNESNFINFNDPDSVFIPMLKKLASTIRGGKLKKSLQDLHKAIRNHNWENDDRDIYDKFYFRGIHSYIENCPNKSIIPIYLGDSPNPYAESKIDIYVYYINKLKDFDPLWQNISLKDINKNLDFKIDLKYTNYLWKYRDCPSTMILDSILSKYNNELKYYIIDKVIEFINSNNNFHEKFDVLCEHYIQELKALKTQLDVWFAPDYLVYHDIPSSRMDEYLKEQKAWNKEGIIPWDENEIINNRFNKRLRRICDKYIDNKEEAERIYHLNEK